MATSRGKSVDEILEHIGQLGRFQITRLAMIAATVISPSFQLFNMFFIGAEAPWQCVMNSTRCRLNEAFVVGDENYDFRCRLNRSDWEYANYDGPRTSIISEFDLVCDDAFYGWLAISMMYFGMACFSIPVGIISDCYGRLLALFPSYIIIIAIGFASTFATQYWQFLLSRFVIGGFLNGVLLASMLLPLELVGPNYRPLSQTVMWCFHSLGSMILTCVAYYVRDWRTMMIIITAPWIVLVVFWKFIPESVRWHATHDKLDKAEHTLRLIAKVNKKEYPDDHLSIPPTGIKTLGFFALFSRCSLIVSVLITSSSGFVASMVYFGASYGASDLGGNMYLNFVLTSLIEIPANFVVVDSCKRFGRKKTVIMYMVLGGIACVIVSVIPGGTQRTDYIAGRVTAGILGKGFITTSFTAIGVWTCEIFPTVVRSNGLAIQQVLICLGGVAAPFLIETERIHPVLPFGTMGAMSILAALLCLILPETKDKPIQEVIKTKKAKVKDGILNCEDENDIEGSPDVFTTTEI